MTAQGTPALRRGRSSWQWPLIQSRRYSGATVALRWRYGGATVALRRGRFSWRSSRLRDESRDERSKLAGLDRLRQVGLKAAPEGLAAVLRPRERRQGNGGDPGARVVFQETHPADQAVAVSVRHSDVAHQDVRPQPLEHRQRFVGGPGGDYLGSGLLQDRAQQLPGIRVVVDHEYPDPSDRRQPRAQGRFYGMRSRRSYCPTFLQCRQLDREPGALSLALALRVDGPAVQLDDVPHDRQSQPEAARWPFALSEPLEDVRQELGLDPGTLVGHPDPRKRRGAFQTDIDTPAHRTELDGIGEEVPDHLPEPIRIGEERSSIRIEEGCQLDVLRIGQAPDSLDGLLDDGHWVDLPALEPQLARHDARHVQQVLDELRQELRVPLDHLEAARRAGSVLGPDAQEAGPSEHGG